MQNIIVLTCDTLRMLSKNTILKAIHNKTVTLIVMQGTANAK